MFFKNSIEKEEKNWRKSIEGRQVEALLEEISAKNIDHINYIIKEFIFTQTEWQPIADKIINDKVTWLIPLVKPARTLNFSVENSLIDTVLKNKSQEMFEVLANECFSSLKLWKEALKAEWEEVLPAIQESGLKNNSGSSLDDVVLICKDLKSDKIYITTIKAIHNAGYSRFPHGSSNAPEKVLNQACIDGNLSRLSILLSVGVHKYGSAFKKALNNGHMPIVEKMIDCGFDYQSLVPEMKTMLHCNESIGHDMKQYLSELLEVRLDKSQPVKEIEEADDGYYSPDMDVISKTIVLANGLSLTTVFNFVQNEKILVTERENPPMMTTVVTPFTDIVDTSGIEMAEKKLIDMKRRSDQNKIVQKAFG